MVSPGRIARTLAWALLLSTPASAEAALGSVVAGPPPQTESEAAAPGAAAPDQPPAPVAASTPVHDVNRLFAEGQVRFDQGDYDGALALWGEAYESAPSTQAGRAFRVGIASHLALAHEYRYRLTRDRVDLQRTEALLRWHIDHYKALYTPTPEARAHIDEMRNWLAQVQATLAQPAAQSVPVIAPAPSPPPPRRPRTHDVRAYLRGDPELWSRYSSGHGMVIGGTVMAAGGGVLAVVSLSLLEGELDNAGLALMGASGAALIGGGVALIVVGSRRKHQAAVEARRRLSLLPTGTGILLTGQF